MTAMQTLQTQSRRSRGRRRLGGRRRDASGRFTSRPRRVRNASRGGHRASRVRASLRTGRTRNLPERDARGRFRRRVSPVSFVAVSPRPQRHQRRIIRRRWWRIDGPQDPTLPNGYTYET